MTEYEIFIKNDKVKFYVRIGWLIVILNIATILYSIYTLNKFQEMKWTLLILFVFVVGVFVFKNYLKKYFPGDVKLLPAFLFIVPAWMILGVPWLAALNVLLLFFCAITARLPAVYVNRAAIFYPSFPKKEIRWTDLTNVVLKDGYLTIDFKNNKLIQQLIDDVETQIDEKEFNEFCKQQLNK